MTGILIYSDQQTLALELLTAARTLTKENNHPIKAITINDQAQSQKLSDSGAEVYQITIPEVSIADTAAVAEVITQAAQKFESNIILISSNRRGKEIAGRVAQKAGAGCLNDVNKISCQAEKIRCSRNSLGGAAIANQQIETEYQVIAIAPRSYEAAEVRSGGSIQELAIDVPSTSIQLKQQRLKSTDNADIQEAEVLVIIGQGIEKEAQVKAEALAKKLGGEIACSKPVATDKKWLPEERIIGLSGKKCKPKLAIILGVSGQVQFTVGIREAGTIVAVNSDENAYLLKMADYAMVADVNALLPQLVDALDLKH